MDRNDRGIVFRNASRLSSPGNPGIFRKCTATASIRLCFHLTGSTGLFQCYVFDRGSVNPRESLRKPSRCFLSPMSLGTLKITLVVARPFLCNSICNSFCRRRIILISLKCSILRCVTTNWAKRASRIQDTSSFTARTWTNAWQFYLCDYEYLIN